MKRRRSLILVLAAACFAATLAACATGTDGLPPTATDGTSTHETVDDVSRFAAEESESAALTAGTEPPQTVVQAATGEITTLKELRPLGSTGFEALPKTLAFDGAEYVRCALYVPASDCAVLRQDRAAYTVYAPQGSALYTPGTDSRRVYIYAYSVAGTEAGSCIAVDFDVYPVGEMLVYRHPDVDEGTLEAALAKAGS